VLCLVEDWLLAFAIVSGFGILLKVTFPIYVAGPFVYWAVTHRLELTRWRTWLMLSPALLIPLPWYAQHFWRVWQVAVEAGAPTAEFYGNSGPGVYFLRLVREGPGVYWAALVALAVIWGITDHKNRWSVPPSVLLVLAWVAAFLFFVFGPFQETRYTAPLLPGLALGIALLMNSRGRIITAVLLAFPLIAMLQNSFELFGKWRVQDARYVRKYDPRRWPQDEIVRRLASGKVLMASDTPHFNADTLSLAAKEARLPLEFATTAYEEDQHGLPEQIAATTFFIYKEGGSERHAWVLNKLGEAAVSEMRQSGDFAEAWSLPMPDGGVAHVFQNVWRNSFVRGSAAEELPESDATFGGLIRLSGVALRAFDGKLEVKYRWQCLRTPDREYWCFTHILDEHNRVIGFLDHPILDGNPSMQSWLPGDEAIEHRRLRSGAIQANRRYALRVGVFHKPSGESLRVTSCHRFAIVDDGAAIVVAAR
jgi:hypothetical protein